MPVSDLYIVQYLLQETLETQRGIVWEERPREQAGYVTHVGDVAIQIEASHSRAGSQLLLHFWHGTDSFTICEPLAKGWFRGTYSSQEERDLAALLRDLMREAAAQCLHRRSWALENSLRIRERVYRRLLFGDSPPFPPGDSSPIS